MKKILLTLAAAFGLAIAGSGTAWADDLTETVYTGYTASPDGDGNVFKNHDVEGNSYIIPGTCVADWQGVSKFKIRTNQTVDGIANAIKFSVKPGYVIKGIKIVAKSANGTTTIKSVYVDDDTSKSAASTTYKFTTSSSTADITGLNATKNIYLISEFDNVSTYQIKDCVVTVTYGYQTTSVTKPAAAIDVTVTCPFNTEDAAQSFTADTDEHKFFSSSAVTLTGLQYSSATVLVNYAESTNTETTYAHKYVENTDGCAQGTDGKIVGATVKEKVAFSIRPKKGMTFVPTSVSFRAARVGTDGGTLNAYIQADDSYISNLASAINPTKGESQTFTYENIAPVECTSENEFTLNVLPYNLAKGKGFALANVEVKGYYYGTAEAETTYKVSSKVNDEAMGTVTPELTDEEYTEGTSVTLTAKPNEGYRFVEWQNANGESVGTNTAYTFNVEAAATYTAVFTKRASFVFAVEDGITPLTGSVLPSTIYFDKIGDTQAAPNNAKYYVEGKTFGGWLNSSNEVVKTLTVAAIEDVTLTAKYTDNAKTLSEALTSLNKATTISWILGTKGSSEYSLQGSGAVGVVVLQAEIEGETYDVPLKVDATSGKFYNTGRTDNAQVNSGTILTLPVVNGAKVVIVATNAFDAETGTQIDGARSYTLSSDKKTATYTYTGNATEIQVVFSSDVKYVASISITYPQTIYAVSISDLGAATFSAPIATTIPENVKAYSGALSEDNTTLTLSEVSGIIPANEPVVLFGDKGEYKFTQAAEAGTKVEGNALKAQLTEAVPTAEEGKAICVLNSVEGQLGFYKLNADKKLGANKAYLPVPVATTSTETAETSAPAVRIVFAGENGNVTGIESIAAEKNANAPIFNLAGQKMQGRVAPGLYIQGGKKILVK